MKSYTDLEQSKKLAEILPHESADMKILPFTEREYRIVPINDISVCGKEDEIYAWSLAALLKVIRETVWYELLCDNTSIIIKCELGDNPWSIEINENNEVDACYEMILKLNEQKLL